MHCHVLCEAAHEQELETYFSENMHVVPVVSECVATALVPTPNRKIRMTEMRETTSVCTDEH